MKNAMLTPASPARPRGFAALRAFLAEKSPEPERCDLCAAAISELHQHLADPDNRRLLCACDACAILFNDNGQTRYKRVPRDSYVLDGLELDAHIWTSLGIPAGLVFFFRSSASGRVMAFYPSPAGLAEAEIDAEVWGEIVCDALGGRDLLSDVEALLVNRLNGVNDYFLAPIDRCYALTGLVRRFWRGLSGGEEAWQAIDCFFKELRQSSQPIAVGAHAGS